MAVKKIPWKKIPRKAPCNNPIIVTTTPPVIRQINYITQVAYFPRACGSEICTEKHGHSHPYCPACGVMLGIVLLCTMCAGRLTVQDKRTGTYSLCKCVDLTNAHCLNE